MLRGVYRATSGQKTQQRLAWFWAADLEDAFRIPAYGWVLVDLPFSHL